jgi:hypothetical protein
MEAEGGSMIDLIRVVTAARDNCRQNAKLYNALHGLIDAARRRPMSTIGAR